MSVVGPDDSLDLDSLAEPFDFLHDRSADHPDSNRYALTLPRMDSLSMSILAPARGYPVGTSHSLCITILDSHIHVSCLHTRQAVSHPGLANGIKLAIAKKSSSHTG